MKIALIPPIPDLERFQDESNVHMMLAHLCGKPGYMKFYAERSKAGDYVILDNGACENDQPMKLPDLFLRALQVRAHEIVLPDVQYDKKGTIYELHQALAWLRSDAGRRAYSRAGRPRLMFVPQGDTTQNWRLCLAQGLTLLNEAGINPVIAVAKQYQDPSYGPSGRVKFVEYLSSMGLYDVHLLGWAPPWDSLVDVAINCPWVRSVDSAKPLSYAKHAVRLYTYSRTERIPREENYFDEPVPLEHEQIARSNIDVFRRSAMG